MSGVRSTQGTKGSANKTLGILGELQSDRPPRKPNAAFIFQSTLTSSKLPPPFMF
jgi:hypothetical protein